MTSFHGAGVITFSLEIYEEKIKEHLQIDRAGVPASHAATDGSSIFLSRACMHPSSPVLAHFSVGSLQIKGVQYQRTALLYLASAMLSNIIPPLRTGPGHELDATGKLRRGSEAFARRAKVQNTCPAASGPNEAQVPGTELWPGAPHQVQPASAVTAAWSEAAGRAVFGWVPCYAPHHNDGSCLRPTLFQHPQQCSSPLTTYE